MSPRRTRAAKTRQPEEQEEAGKSVSEQVLPPMTPKNMKVVELREALMARGLSAKGLKQELVLRLEEALDDHNQPAEAAKPTTSAKSATAAAVVGEEDQTESHSPTKRRKARHQPKEQETVKTEEHFEPAVIPAPKETTPADEPTTIYTPPQSFALPESSALSESTPALPESALAPATADTPAEQWAHIKNLRRPFTLAAIRNLLEQFGPIAEFWLDPLKTQCLVRYCTVNAHVDCIHKLSGLKWPPEIGNTLEAQTVTGEEKQQISVASEPKRPVDHHLSPSLPAREAEPPSLDTIFLKTITQPQLYYLPACSNLEE